MKYILLVIGILIGLYLARPSDGFEVPVDAGKIRSGSGVRQLEFTHLLDDGTPFADLTRAGYYTVIEGYLDTCSICRDLESRFPRFLAQRNDVLIRRVRFPEQISGGSDDFFRRMSAYNFVHLAGSGSDQTMALCGTPHVEIYGPDQKLIATDLCSERIGKEGLAFLRRWMAAESS